MKFYSYVLFYFLSFNSSAQIVTQNPQSIPTTEIQHFETYPNNIKNLLTIGLDLAKQNLGYQYGSANPKIGGMDCSGTVFYILNSFGVKEVPRSSDLIYKWAVDQGHFHPVNYSGSRN